MVWIGRRVCQWSASLDPRTRVARVRFGIPGGPWSSCRRLLVRALDDAAITVAHVALGTSARPKNWSVGEVTMAGGGPTPMLAWR